MECLIATERGISLQTAGQRAGERKVNIQRGGRARAIGKPLKPANVASSEPNGAWVALTHNLFKPVVSNNSEGVDADDWLNECEETPIWLSEGDDRLNPELLEETRGEAHTSLDTALLTSTDLTSKGHIVKLFDSGATQHMTPTQSLLKNYSTITPKAMSAVNKHSFNMIGNSNLKLDIPNRKSTNSLILKEVLHAPDMTITFISVGHIDQAEYSAIFKGSIYTIHNVKGHTLGSSQPIQDGTYSHS